MRCFWCDEPLWGERREVPSLCPYDPTVDPDKMIAHSVVHLCGRCYSDRAELQGIIKKWMKR
jgi:hypothetical protein